MDNLRRFIVVFTLVIFLTLSICGIVLANSYRKMAHTEEHDITVSAPTYDPNSANSQDKDEFRENILFILGDSDGSETDIMVIINVDTDTSSLNFMYIPKDMKFATSSDRTVDIMGNMLARKGSPESCANILSSFFEMNIDYYIQMPCNVFPDFINAFDADNSGISYTIPIDMKYVTGKYNIDLKKDTNVLHGEEALSLVQFYRTENDEYYGDMLQYYDGSDIMRINAAQAFLSAFLSQKVIKTGDQSYPETFAQIAKPFLERCSTNITENDLSSIGKVLSSVNSNGVRYYRFTGNDQYIDRFYIVYNYMCKNLIGDSDFESASVIRNDFKTN